jgi:hypothetical protein
VTDEEKRKRRGRTNLCVFGVEVSKSAGIIIREEKTERPHKHKNRSPDMQSTFRSVVWKKGEGGLLI